MKRTVTILCLLPPLLLCITAGAQSRTKPRIWDKKTFLDALNEAASHFKTLTANLELTKVTKVVDHREVESGRLFFRKNNRIKIEFTEPEPKMLLFDGRKAEIYYPKMGQIQEFNLSKHHDMIEQFLLLGFGTRGDDLEDSYLITVMGETTLRGRAALEVKLTPKDEKIRESVHEIRLWFDLASWAPLQQQFLEVGGDHTTTRYTNVRVNGPINPRDLKLNVPHGTKRVKPQGGL